MKAHIFTDDSDTTSDNLDLPVVEYYEGTFRPVASLYHEMNEFAATSLHVLSEEYGVVHGQQKLKTLSEKKPVPVGSNEMVKATRKKILHATVNADVIVFLLSSDLFRRTVTQVWDEILDTAKPDSILCFSAARTALDVLNFDKLEQKNCTVLTYQRVGVARIDTKTRKELISAIKQKRMI